MKKIEYDEKIPEGILKIFPIEKNSPVEENTDDIEPSEEIAQRAEESIFQELDKLIEQLPDHFPGAMDIIVKDITPYLMDCNPGIKDHYVKVIKKRTNAASIKSVSMLIDEAIKEINVSVPALGEGSVEPIPIDSKIVEEAERIAQDPMLFKKKSTW
jgi:hypothetical protein